MDEPYLTILKLAAVLLLVLANGYFVASEFSLVSVRKTRIDQLIAEGSGRARAVRKALDRTDDFIAATQLGITMASLLLGWIGEPALAHLVVPLFRLLGLSETGAFWSAHGLSVVVAFSVITALHIVLGELAPKTIALQASESTALWIARPLQVFLFIFRPFIYLMNGMGRFTVRLLGFEPASEAELIHSEEEIRMLVRDSARGGALEPHEKELIESAFELDRITAAAAMLPRTEMVAVPHDISLPELLHLAADAGYTRYPVYHENTDNIVGVINIKSLVSLVAERLGSGNVGDFNVLDYAQQPLLIPETVHADDVLAEMSRFHTQMAIVIDEYGGTAGIVTREGLLDRLVGGVSEDPEDVSFDFERINEDEVVVNGLFPISELQEQLGVEVDADGYNTVGGLVLGALGSMAEVGSTARVDGYVATVEEMDGLRIARLRLHRAEPDLEPQEDEG
ncbi:MAG: hemolysin family protein [Chloroflexota bacterium]|nr:hemolysin family protein [Chloroflexota bacterium]